MPTFELERLETEDAHVVHVAVAGELDLTNARELEDRLDELTHGDAPVLVLDLNRVVFIDSAALHVLFRAARQLGRDRLGLVVGHSAPIARTLAIVGLPQAAVTGESTDAVLGELGGR
jgi:anti-anti-sigma factor